MWLHRKQDVSLQPSTTCILGAKVALRSTVAGKSCPCGTWILLRHTSHLQNTFDTTVRNTGAKFCVKFIPFRCKFTCSHLATCESHTSATSKLRQQSEWREIQIVIWHSYVLKILDEINKYLQPSLIVPSHFLMWTFHILMKIECVTMAGREWNDTRVRLHFRIMPSEKKNSLMMIMIMKMKPHFLTCNSGLQWQCEFCLDRPLAHCDVGRNFLSMICCKSSHVGARNHIAKKWRTAASPL